jgi:hypothetical protein
LICKTDAIQSGPEAHLVTPEAALKSAVALYNGKFMHMTNADDHPPHATNQKASMQKHSAKQSGQQRYERQRLTYSLEKSKSHQADTALALILGTLATRRSRILS